jgi:hypothetical protein
MSSTQQEMIKQFHVVQERMLKKMEEMLVIINTNFKHMHLGNGDHGGRCFVKPTTTTPLDHGTPINPYYPMLHHATAFLCFLVIVETSGSYSFEH